MNSIMTTPDDNNVRTTHASNLMISKGKAYLDFESSFAATGNKLDRFCLTTACCDRGVVSAVQHSRS